MNRRPRDNLTTLLSCAGFGLLVLVLLPFLGLCAVMEWKNDPGWEK